jgi:5'-deoxynucleotidase
VSVDLWALYRSGAVRRYHTNVALAPLGQTNADHQGRCVQLLMALHPGPSAELIRAVAFHDVGEWVVGDLPMWFKRSAPEFAECHAEIEAGVRADVLDGDPLLDLTEAEHRWLKFIDSLEAWCFCATHAPGEIGRNGWPEQAERLRQQAWSLSADGAVASQLVTLMQGMRE